MFKNLFLVVLLFFPVLCFTQENRAFRVIGAIPPVENPQLYEIQVGSFGDARNAQIVFRRLVDNALNPVMDNYRGLTRVIAAGIPARDVIPALEKLKQLGFAEVWIREDTRKPQATVAPVVATPSPAQRPAPVVAHPRPQTPTSAPVVVTPRPPVSAPTPVTPAPYAQIPAPAPVVPPAPVLVHPAVTEQPAPSVTEIGFRTVRIGETKSLSDLVTGKQVTRWSSNVPTVFSANANAATVTGISIGSGYVTVNETEYISIAVVPPDNFYLLPDSETSILLPPTGNAGASRGVFNEFRTEPTFRLAYRFRNPGIGRGSSGETGGIDILARGENYEWLPTTFEQEGWFYNLNGVGGKMVNGFQRDDNTGVELTIVPEFVYDNGIPHLQLRHILRNTRSVSVTNQRFGASADVMMHNNDYASLLLKPYGAYMADADTNPKLELMLVCLTGEGITPVDTLWLGTWDFGAHVERIYDDNRADVIGQDTAIAFSYQNITLGPGEAKEFIIRFTVIRGED